MGSLVRRLTCCWQPNGKRLASLLMLAEGINIEPSSPVLPVSGEFAPKRFAQQRPRTYSQVVHVRQFAALHVFRLDGEPLKHRLRNGPYFIEVLKVAANSVAHAVRDFGILAEASPAAWVVGRSISTGPSEQILPILYGFSHVREECK
jgi:hypothetical protein